MKLQLKHPLEPYAVNQPFGVNGDYYRANGIMVAGHNGLDLRANHGQPVYASHDGTAYYEIDASQGHGVVIRTNETFDYEGEQVYFKTIYWHLADSIKEPSLKSPVEDHPEGLPVKCGDLIGYADNTGFSSGDHLHFGLKPQAQNEGNGDWSNVNQNNGYGGAIDPAPYLPPIKFYFLTDLEYGMTNIDVRNLQVTLNRDPDTVVALTGIGSAGHETSYFGTLTKVAVIKYQKKHGIDPIGRVGKLTRASLNQG